ncbi:MAG: hypothetical protein QGG98_02695 [Pseudomonadales bacterium]|nr:hypothetical protein [Pseudomonadales bacterium]MDP7145701.1 hypothetical protein [Pseudomonadales bacterium]MDP7357896.1 hypothetical protein [Pseudomonadales bacterium]
MRWKQIKYPMYLAYCLVAVNVGADSCQTANSERDIRVCLEKARSCGEIVDPFKRLSCYDVIYQPIEPVADSESKDKQPTAATSRSVPVAEDKKKAIAARPDDEKFPLSRTVAKKPAQERVRMEAKIVKLQKGPRRNMTITLDNDQIWRENAASSLPYRIGATVTIEKGLFGSNDLTLEGQNKKSKVNRIQ